MLTLQQQADLLIEDFFEMEEEDRGALLRIAHNFATHKGEKTKLQNNEKARLRLISSVLGPSGRIGIIGDASDSVQYLLPRPD